MAYFIAAAAPSMDAANALLPTYCITLLLFAGQLMTFQAMAWWLRWYSVIDVLTYSWGALMVGFAAARLQACRPLKRPF